MNSNDVDGATTAEGSADAAEGVGTAALDSNDASPQQDSSKQKVSYLSLEHKGQLAIVCLARLADPLAASSIQSYLFYQLKFFDPTASDSVVSSQAGLVFAARTAAQVCTGMLWGRVADSDWGGRKMVLLTGLFSCCLASVGYGMSSTLASAMIWQCLGGAFSSNVSMVRCVSAELYPEKRHRVRALTLLPMCSNAGTLLGPLVGGYLSSEPGGSGILANYPYLVPNLVVSAVYLSVAIGVIFGVDETLKSKRESDPVMMRVWTWIRSRWTNDQHQYQPVRTDEPGLVPSTSHLASHPSDDQSPLFPGASNGPSQNPLPRKLGFRRIWTFNVVSTMLSHFIIAGHLGTFAILWASFLSAKPADQSQGASSFFKFGGGLGMKPHAVGSIMALLASIVVFLQVIIYPTVQDRFGTLLVWRVCLFAFPLAYLFAPYPAFAGAAPEGSAGQVAQHAPRWIALVAVLFVFGIGRTGVTPATSLLINDCTPHPSVRGTIHTTATVVGNLSRTVYPPLFTFLFGKGLEIGVVGLGFWCLAGLATLACIQSRWVIEGNNGEDPVRPKSPQFAQEPGVNASPGQYGTFGDYTPPK